MTSLYLTPQQIFIEDWLICQKIERTLSINWKMQPDWFYINRYKVDIQTWLLKLTHI